MGNGLAGCNDTQYDQNSLQNVSQINLGKCSVCPANLYQSCTNALGPEWDFDYSQSEGVGCKAICKRIAYTNKNTDCCLGIQSKNQHITCDPSMNSSNPACVSPIIDYCSLEPNINSSFCNSLNPNLKKAVLDVYCNNVNNISSKPICRNYAASVDNAGKIDNIMSQFCKTNYSDDLCCYMNSSIPCPNKFDSRCFNKAAYQTSAMVSTKCPDVLNCYQYANLDPSTKLFATNIQLNCGNKTASPKNAGSFFSFNASNTYLFIILLMLYKMFKARQ